MENYETMQYPTAGSAALESEYEEHIIEFPFLPDARREGRLSRPRLLQAARHAAQRVARAESVQELLHGSLKGQAINRAKRWQTLLMGGCFLAVAIACVYFGR